MLGFCEKCAGKLADKFDEVFPKIRQDVLDSYDKEELEEAMKKAGVSTSG